MSDVSMQSLRDLLKDRPQGLTFADLPATVLEDLALGWSGGKATAEVAAELASRIDGIPKRGRDQEIAGRAVLIPRAPWQLPHTAVWGSPARGSPKGAGGLASVACEAKYIAIFSMSSVNIRLSSASRARISRAS